MSRGTVQPDKGKAPPDFVLASLEEDGVRDLAEHLARGAKGGEVFLLEGPLGAGKTFFTRSFAAGLGIVSGIASPTYVLHCEHRAPRGLAVHHLDFYRLTGAAEAQDLGVEELCHPGAVVLAEWPDRCPGVFEAFTLRLRFTVIDDSSRRIEGWWGELPFDRSAIQPLL